VWTTPEDWAILAEKGVTCVHNPVSNLKLGSGVADIPGMLAAGVNVALGTDGVSSNNSHDMFEELKLAAILHKGTHLDPMAITPAQALEMATVNGAKALGRPTGMVAAGRVADLILVDFRRPNLIPCHDIAENLVFSARGSDVTMNMARGRVIYENGQFLTLDLERIRREVEEYALPKLFG
jgi:5-methylthioadenosine/S-adenosylhomocysteine deaminase